MSTDYEIQIWLDSNDKSSHDPDGVLHVMVVGDATPLCGKDDDGILPTWWSDVLTVDAAGAMLVAPDHPICGKCSDVFWSGELNG